MGTKSDKRKTITTEFLNIVRISNDSWLDRFYVPILLFIGIAYSAFQLINRDIPLAATSLFISFLLLAFATFTPLQKLCLGQTFKKQHAAFISFTWAYSLILLWLFRSLESLPIIGKESQSFFVFICLIILISYRLFMTIFAISRWGYAYFMMRCPTWEQYLVMINDLLAMSILSFIAGHEIARVLQPSVFTIYVDPVYSISLLSVASLYFLVMQFMWFQSWNDWISQNRVWVSFARIFAPLALIICGFVIVRHFTRLSDPRTANLAGTANLDQTVLAVSPLIWMLILFITLMVYSGNRGLRQRLLPDLLMDNLPNGLRKFLSTVSDMDLLLILGMFIFTIPLQLFLVDDESQGLLDILRTQISGQNALIDSSEQALAFLFSIPFYLLTLFFLILYAYVMIKPHISSQERDKLVNRLPVSMLIVFIIVLYLCAIPFSLVLTQGRLPQLSQDLGRILAFDILIPLVLLYVHYFLLVRIPYSRGQASWRKRQGLTLEAQLAAVDDQILQVESSIRDAEKQWQDMTAAGDSLRRIDLLYQFINYNGDRDELSMRRLGLVEQRQELADISDTPIALGIARLPARVVSIGIPILILFKVYEWAIVNDGLREVANNPNIGVIEFFQTILEQTQF